MGENDKTIRFEPVYFVGDVIKTNTLGYDAFISYGSYTVPYKRLDVLKGLHVYLDTAQVVRLLVAGDVKYYSYFASGDNKNAPFYEPIYARENETVEIQVWVPNTATIKMIWTVFGHREPYRLWR